MTKTISVRLKFDSNGTKLFAQLKGEADSVSKALSGLQGQTKSFTGQLSETINMIAGIGFAAQNMSSGVQNLASGFMSFDTAMRQANTMAQKTGAEFTALEDSIKKMSQSVPLAREELANGLYQVVSNGVPEDNWIAFLEQSAKAAVGGLADLGETVNVTSTLIKNYGLGWESAMEIQDKIQMTAKNGVTSFGQLAGALPSIWKCLHNKNFNKNFNIHLSKNTLHYIAFSNNFC